MTRARFPLALMLGTALALAACGSDPDVDDSDITDQAREDAPSETGVAVDNIASEQVPGIDDPVPMLEDLGEVSVDLGDTLGACRFVINDQTLFLAGSQGSSRARGNGVIQVAGVDRLLAGAELTEPEGIEAGPTMTDGEYTVTIERGAGEGRATGNETVAYPAELVVRKDAANEVRYGPGTWNCGV